MRTQILAVKHDHWLSVCNLCEGICEQLFQAKGFCFFLRFILIAKNRESLTHKNPKQKNRKGFSLVCLSRVGTPTISWAHTLIIHLLCVCVEFLYSPDWTPQHFARVFVFVFFLLQRYAFTRVVTSEDPIKNPVAFVSITGNSTKVSAKWKGKVNRIFWIFRAPQNKPNVSVEEARIFYRAWLLACLDSSILSSILPIRPSKLIRTRIEIRKLL